MDIELVAVVRRIASARGVVLLVHGISSDREGVDRSRPWQGAPAAPARSWGHRLLSLPWTAAASRRIVATGSGLPQALRPIAAPAIPRETAC
jgi:hypothetical protein